MIVTPEGDGLVVFAQEAHAHLAGELALWLPGGEGERSAFVAAARLHDNGWREAEVAPTVDAEGRPHTFHAVPPDVYVGVWRRGIGRAAAVDPLVGLLVGLHGARFFGGSAHPEVRALHEEERARQNRVLGELGLGGTWRDLPPAVRSASDWIRFLDLLSLMVCGALDDVVPFEVGGTAVRIVRAGDTLTIDPWPFTGPGRSVSINGRHLASASFPSAEALRAALASAPTATWTRSLQPAAGV
jgi:hypothetical protein